MNALALDEADIDLLPPSMQWLAKAIGLPAVLKLVKRHGGGAPIYVPVRPHPDHALLHLIGAQAFAALVAEYGGDLLEIARCEKATRILIHRQIRRDKDSSQNDLAIRYEYTVRQIRNIQAGDEDVDDRQSGLF